MADIGEIGMNSKFAKSGKMTPAQSHFAGPRRPIEELYGCEMIHRPFNLALLKTSKNSRK